MPDRYLIYPETRRGHGTGHLERSFHLARELSTRGHEVELLVPASGDGAQYGAADVAQLLELEPSAFVLTERPRGTYRWVILDRRTVDEETFTLIGPLAATLGLDAGGSARERCTFLLDTLGRPPGAGRANVTNAAYLPLPNAIRQQWPARIQHALVTTGREDGGRRAVAIAGVLARGLDVAVTAVARDVDPPAGVTVMAPAPDLRERLHRFDLVVTHYGITAFEALHARVPVLLLNPTRYHTRLARRAGIPVARSPQHLVRLAGRGLENLVAQGRAARPERRRSIAELVEQLHPPTNVSFIADRAHAAPVAARFEDRTFRQDPASGSYVLQRFTRDTITYGEDYFFAEYREQYGRTYLEDFEHIAALGMRRIGDLERVGLQRGAHVLDLGCAYGAFLTALERCGMNGTGFDISPAAVRWAQATLGHDARHVDLERWEPTDGVSYDAVTMWYVLEHIPYLDLLLGRIARVLPRGGLFAVATPNGRGVSARRDLRRFLASSPDDHCTVFTPRALTRVLDRHGFEPVRIRITGHHPERFGGLAGRLARSGTIGFRAVRCMSRLAGLGDTFEWIGRRR